MAATLDRNVTDDKSGAEELEHAPTNGDDVESAFGNVDYVGFRIQSRTTTSFGVAQAVKMGAFLSWKEQLAKLTQQRSPAKMSAADIDNEKEKWKLKCYFSIPKEERWRALRDIQRRFKELCVVAPREQKAKHDELMRERELENVAQAEAASLRKRASFDVHKGVAVIVTTAGLTALRAASAKDTGKGSYLWALKSQLRARQHVYGQTPKDGLPILGDDTLADLTRIDAGLRLLLDKPLPPRGSGPSPLPSRDRSQAVAPTELAKEIAATYEKRVQAAWVELGEHLRNGVFKLPRRLVTEGSPRKPRAPRAPKPRAPPAAQEQALVGEVFDDEGTMWKVIGMAWSDEHQAMVVYYYDIDAVDSVDLAEIELMPQLALCTHDAVEFSTVKEVVKWIKETAKQSEGAGRKRLRG